MSPPLGCWSETKLGSGEGLNDRVLINMFSGERVRMRGHVDLPGRHPGLRWLRLDYLNDDLEFPVVASWLPDEGHIVLDYEASAALWRRETSSDQAYPPYGTWVRVDDCVIDAIWCWPEILETLRWPSEEGPAGGWIGRIGGWSNGAWRSDFYRVDIMLPEPPHFRSIGSAAAFPMPVSRLMPLDQAAPSPWFYVDATSFEDHERQGHTSWEGRGLYWEIEASGERYDYEELRTVMVNGVVPHMRSQDGTRIFYPWDARIYEGYPNDSSIDFVYRTEDHGWEDAMFSRAGSFWGAGSHQRVVWPTLYLGAAPRISGRLVEEIHFVETRKQQRDHSQRGVLRLLSLGARRRVARDLVDAFLAWDGTEQAPEAWGKCRGGLYPTYERPEFIIERYRIVGGDYCPVLTFAALSLPEEFKRLGFHLDRFVAP